MHTRTITVRLEQPDADMDVEITVAAVSEDGAGFWTEEIEKAVREAIRKQTAKGTVEAK